MITSADPMDVTATTLAGRTVESSRRLRDQLSARNPDIQWQSARGGALGKRPGKDPRVFLAPYPGWMVFARPGDLGQMLAASSAPLGTYAETSAVPTWLRGLHALSQTGDDQKGPIAILTVQNLPKALPSVDLLPQLDNLPLPQRAALSLEPDPKGFLVRGVLHFKTKGQATTFIMGIGRAQAELTTGFLSRPVLEKAKALNAVAGLTFRQKAKTVTLATSVSNRDADHAMSQAARWARSYYNRRRR